MAQKVILPPALVPIAQQQPDGQLLVSSQWQKVLEQMAKRINELEARIVALGG